MAEFPSGEGFSQPFQSQYDFDLDHRPIQQPDKFKPMIVQLAQALKPEDVESLRFCYKHRLKASGSQMKGALEILENLEENGLFTCNNLVPLMELLRNIQRHDLLGNVENFQSNLLNPSLSPAPVVEVSQPIPVGPPRSLNFPTTTHGQQLTSMPEEESLGLNDDHKSEEIAALMVAGTYSSMKSFKQGSVPPVSGAHGGEEVQSLGTAHQPVSQSQPTTIYPPPQRQRHHEMALSSSRPLFQIADSTLLEKSASEGSLQDIIPGDPDLENPPAEVKSKPLPTTMPDAKENLPNLHIHLPQPIPQSPGNASYAGIEPRAASIEAAGNQVPAERSISSLSDASTQTVLKGSPFKQDKWMSKTPIHKCDLDRKKLYSMIGSHDYSCFPAQLKFRVLCENGKGPTLSFKIFPFSYDQNTHMSVQVSAKFASKSKNPVFVNDLCYCTLRVEVTPYHQQGSPLTETSTISIPLSPNCYEFKNTIDKVLSHCEIFYCRSDIITLHVQAFLECSEMFEAVVDAADDDGYVLVKKHHPASDQRRDHTITPGGGQT